MRKIVFILMLIAAVSVYGKTPNGTFVNNSTPYKWTELSKEIVSACDENACRFSVDLEMLDGVVYLTMNGVPSSLDWYGPNSNEVCFVDFGEEDNEVIWRHILKAAYDYPALYNNIRMKYMVEGVPEGEKMLGFEISYRTGEAFAGEKVNLYDGCRYHIEATSENCNIRNCRKVPFYDMEWVVYNPCDNSGSERFFRIRYGSKGEINCRPNENPNDMRFDYDMLYPVMMCEGEKFEAEKADTVAYMSAFYRLNGTTSVRACDVEIPSEFWGTGLAEATVNPSKWPNFNGTSDILDTYMMISKDERFFNYYDFTDERFGMGFPTETGTIETPVGTLDYLDLDGGHAHASWKARWVEIIGAVGDGYASNLPYPVYSLPEGATPAHLLYVRDVVTNEILWGDASKDSGYNGIEGIAPEPAEGVSAAEGESRFFDLQGMEVRNPGRGIYIRVREGKAEKVLISE